MLDIEKPEFEDRTVSTLDLKHLGRIRGPNMQDGKHFSILTFGMHVLSEKVFLFHCVGVFASFQSFGNR